MLVMVVVVLAQGVYQVGMVPDQCPVEQFVTAGVDPAFHDRLHAWHPDAAANNRDPGVSEDRVKQGGVLAVSVPNQVRHLVRMGELLPRLTSRCFQQIDYHAWKRIGDWIRRKHYPISWREIRHRYTHGGRYAATGSPSYGAASVKIERYRGSKIPNPCTITDPNTT